MRSAWIVCCALGLAAPALADAENGLYLELQGGASFIQDADLSVSNGGMSTGGKAEFDTGWTAGGAIGFRMFDMLRLEAHGSWRMADIDTVKLGGVESSAGDAFAGAAAFLGNAYFDIPVGQFPIHPYVGGGAGVAIFHADSDSNSVDINDEDTRFAWNVMGGFFVPVLKHLELDVRYRYITSDDPKVDADLLGLGSGKVRAEFESHEVVGAVRVVF